MGQGDMQSQNMSNQATYAQFFAQGPNKAQNQGQPRPNTSASAAAAPQNQVSKKQFQHNKNF